MARSKTKQNNSGSNPPVRERVLGSTPSKQRGWARDDGGRAPDVFKYHDARAFLRDWYAHQKARNVGIGLASISRSSGISVSYVSMLLTGARALNAELVRKLGPVLGLEDAQVRQLEILTQLSDGKGADERIQAAEQLASVRGYRKLNPKESAVFRYLSRPHYVAIREMAELPEFKFDPAWIKERLCIPSTIREITEALSFLTSNGFIEKTAEGRAIVQSEPLECDGRLYSLALNKFYKEMHRQASRSIDETVPEKRNLRSFTVATDSEKFKKLHAAIDRFYEEVRAIAQEGGPEDAASPASSVYHVSLSLFPLADERATKAGSSEESGDE